MLLSWGCHNKLPQIGWLRQQKCTVLQSWRLEVEVQQDWFLLAALEENLFQTSSLASEGLRLIGGVVSGPRHHLCVSAFKFLLFIRTPILYWVRVYPNDLILTRSFVKALFPNRVTFTDAGGWDFTIFRGHNLTHNRWFSYFLTWSKEQI